ncbi:RNA polymerase sigma factor [Agaribacterium sp. ZY112]|uniref:RNA polymerase sigma factor n=1 Tax=Agaribacterium sp. ZY112 TaxID=3233574 RepID=UPI0035265793
MEIEQLVKQAITGNKTALEGVTAAIQDKVYYLALRMLVNPEDAKDATQEILIKVITRLSSFRFESQFTTWVHRLAANYLLTEKKVLNKDLGLNFDLYKQDLESDLQEQSELKNKPSYPILLNELRISCTMAMLLCLKPAHRMAYILGDIYDMEHSEASAILDISKSNFRQQLSRARTKVVAFTQSSCGLVSSCAKCRCEKKLAGSIKRNRVSADHIYFASDKQFSYQEIKNSLTQTQQELRTLALQQSIQYYKSPIELSETIEALVSEGLNKHKRPA